MALAFAKTALDLLFPPLCIGCRAPVADAGFCAACWSGLTFLDGPGCSCCGLLFPVALEGENLCAACLARPPAFDRARAILAYDDNSRGAILALKHADRLELVPGFARWLGRTGQELIAQSDVIIPVPLHRSRLWQRRYNQSAELARRLARDFKRDSILSPWCEAAPRPVRAPWPRPRHAGAMCCPPSRFQIPPG
jgi:predicted amidophosphoribosyltransferase